jgi:4-hydroxybenzoate polyprenyltransferase
MRWLPPAHREPRERWEVSMAESSPASGAARRPVTLRKHLLGYVQVTHPLPSAMYVVGTALLSALAATATHRGLDGGALAKALIGVGAAQIAIGSFNDYRDRALDAASNRMEKPLVRGAISPNEVVALGVTASVVVLAAFAMLGPLALALGILIEGLGLAYDFRFKGTPWSAVLFACYFPLFPLLAWVVFGRWQPFLPWLLPIGAALGIAMNVANTLPDLEADLKAGMRGLPHLLGLRRGLLVAWATPPLVLALMLALHLTSIVPARGPGLLVAAVAGIAVPLACVLLYRAQATPSTLRTTFLLQGVGVIALAGGWIASVAF